MSLRSLALPADIPGKVWLSAMPGRYGSWTNFLREAEQANVTLLVCLTPRREIASHAPDYAAAVESGALPFTWLNLVMRDFGLATDAESFDQGIHEIARTVGDGGRVVLHCAAGIGRTGTAAACVLKRLGVPRDMALDRVRHAGSSPESATQSGLIDRY